MKIILSKSLQLVKQNENSIFLGICIILISAISYNLGRLSSNGKTSVQPTNLNNSLETSATNTSTSSIIIKVTPKPKPQDLRVVASKNSSAKKYHYTWCSGATKILEANKIWFASAQEAESRGYTLAGNCSL